MSPNILRDVLLGYEGKGNVGLVGGFEERAWTGTPLSN